MIHPGTGLAASPRIPGERPIPGEGDPREAFAEWLTSPENPYFARAAVNRIWRELMGRGLVEPVDDHRATNPPTHPALLDALARDLVAHGFDTRHTIRTILASEAYRRESRPVPGSPDDDRFYSHALARPCRLTCWSTPWPASRASPSRSATCRAGTSAGSLGDSRVASEPLDLLGRCRRESGCAPTTPRRDRSASPSTRSTARGSTPSSPTRAAGCTGWCASGATTARSSRSSTGWPWAAGRATTSWPTGRARSPGRAGPGGSAALEDFAWALLLSPEFTRNH